MRPSNHGRPLALPLCIQFEYGHTMDKQTRFNDEEGENEEEE